MRQIVITLALVAAVLAVLCTWALVEKPGEPNADVYGNVVTVDDPQAATHFGLERPGIYVLDRDGRPRSAVRGGLGLFLRGWGRLDWQRMQVGARGIRAGLFLTNEGWILLLVAGSSIGMLVGAAAAASAAPVPGLLAALLGGVFVVGILLIAREPLIAHDLRLYMERSPTSLKMQPVEPAAPPPPPPPSHRPRPARTAELEEVATIPDSSDEDPGVEGGVEGGVVGGILGGVLDEASADSPAASGGILRVSGDVRPPEVIDRVAPVYPEIARKARIQGIVILEATIDASGSVTAVKVLRGIPLLDQAAVEAVQQWTFRPATLNGRPVAVYFTLTVNFRLEE